MRRAQVIAARYEFCEDLATMLTEHAQTMLFDLGITEDDVLERCHRGLCTDDVGRRCTAEADMGRLSAGRIASAGRCGGPMPPLAPLREPSA